ncbi:DUF1223 domain-containing protein [Parerythrobacter lacustris]|uniref:DUF1223 domain-containing protein n=1 Tax=Parerythrobacter lacustris TaxID=2969984 RepID=A0ABT1XL98_9SPHN|nr:DUF1223 domain-containing protein [Parerythrobacter lacustris]MCR2832435.1 DUF1223 domain-containing protein [Parerythrobacter lacustris]
MKTPALIAAIAITAAGVWGLNHSFSSGSSPRATSLKLASSSASPVLVELFTSQGCSSCPPADALAEKLAQDPSLVVVTRPVTYWDRLGWKDTLAREANTQLQRSYSSRGIPGAGVYTPQIVIDGRAGTVGSRAREVRSLVRDSAAKPHAVLKVAKRKEGGFEISTGGSNGGELSLVALTSHVSVAIGRGENGGRNVGYSNVVRAETKLVPGKNGSFHVEQGQLETKGADRYAVILRDRAEGTVRAARYL